MSERNEKTLPELLERHYPLRLEYSEEDACWYVSYPDLPGCLADGETQEEALRNGDDVKSLWIEAAFKGGKSIPEPSVEEYEYSGKIHLRLPRFLHRKLKLIADRQQTSMNTLIVTFLGQAAAVFDAMKATETMVTEARRASLVLSPQANTCEQSSWGFIHDQLLSCDAPTLATNSRANLPNLPTVVATQPNRRWSQ